MERVSFVCGTSSSCRNMGRHFSCFQGSALWFLILSLRVLCAVSERNMEIIDPDTVGVWNKTLFKDIRQCLDFHEANVSSYFFYWPEDSFYYCCNFENISTGQNLREYRYSMYGSYIASYMYYDLGLIDESLPYWTRKSRRLYDKFVELQMYSAACEYTDVISLYNNRFWRLVFGEFGLAKTALPLILFLQLSVFLVITLDVVYWRYWHPKDKADMPDQKLKDIAKKWFNGSWKNACMDWLHLCLLSIIGNGLVEAVGRINSYSWQAKTFHRYSIVYLALSVLLWVSSILHQVTHWIAVDEKVTKAYDLKKKTSTAPSDGPGPEGVAEGAGSSNRGRAEETRVQMGHHVSIIPESVTISKEDPLLDPKLVGALRKVMKLEKRKDPVEKLRELLSLGPDWKWQPIAAQTAILFCLWAFLTYPTGDSGFASGLLGFLVQAASPWSGLYACRVLFVTLPFLLKKVFDVKHIRYLPSKLRQLYKTPCCTSTQVHANSEAKVHEPMQEASGL